MGDGTGESDFVEKPGLRKKWLKPGALVRNARSGSVGEVFHNTANPKKLAVAAPHCIQVRVRLQSGKYTYPFWRLKNLFYKAPSP